MFMTKILPRPLNLIKYDQTRCSYPPEWFDLRAFWSYVFLYWRFNDPVHMYSPGHQALQGLGEAVTNANSAFCGKNEISEWKKKTTFFSLAPNLNCKPSALGWTHNFFWTLLHNTKTLSLIVQKAMLVQLLKGLIQFNYPNSQRASKGKLLPLPCWCCFRLKSLQWGGCEADLPILLDHFLLFVHTRLPLTPLRFGEKGVGSGGEEWGGKVVSGWQK